MVSPDITIQPCLDLEELVKNNGFSQATYLRQGSSGIAFHVVDEESRQEALLKMSPKTPSSIAQSLANELDVITERRYEALGDIAL